MELPSTQTHTGACMHGMRRMRSASDGCGSVACARSPATWQVEAVQVGACMRCIQVVVSWGASCCGFNSISPEVLSTELTHVHACTAHCKVRQIWTCGMCLELCCMACGMCLMSCCMANAVVKLGHACDAYASNPTWVLNCF
jgi:hypothetical protein